MSNIVNIPTDTSRFIRGLPKEVVRLNILLNNCADALREWSKRTPPSPDAMAALADALEIAATGDVAAAREQLNAALLISKGGAP